MANDYQIDLSSFLPKGKELYKFQEQGIKFLLNSPSQHLYLGDDCGLGKSIQSLVFSNAINAKKILIICPASLRLNWQREFMDWRFPELEEPIVIKSSKDIMVLLDPNSKILNPNIIINYELISSKTSPAYAFLLIQAFDLIILDEAHYIRSIDSNRTKKILSLCEHQYKTNNTRTLMLSGTPMLNSAIDLYPPLKFIFQRHPTATKETLTYFQNIHKFAHKFCNIITNNFGTQYIGAKNHSTLNHLLKVEGAFFIRRTKEQVLKQLPKKSFNRFDLDVKSSHVFSPEEEDIMKDIENNITLAEKHFATLRRELGLLKASSKDTKEIIDLLIAQSPNKCLVIFFYHTATKEKILEKLNFKYRIVTHDGKTSAANKQRAVDDFQSGIADIFLAQVDAATGYTVTRASDCLFIEYPYLPTIIDQAYSRILRIGQESKTATAHFLVSNNKLDKILVKNLIKKQQDVDKVVEQ